jgi:hypothetical protein
MSDSEIIEKIEEFGEYLSLGNVIGDMFRWLGWVFIKGLAFIVDGLESVTDDMLLIKQFFQNPEIVAFVDTIRPFLYILLAFSLLYAGYLLIFQKKFDREGMAINLFIALAIVVALSQGMGKANEFTDEAIKAINTTDIYEKGEGSLSDTIISQQLTDLLEFDKDGWQTTEVDPPNTLPLSMIGHVSVTEKLDEERQELEISPEGKDIVSHKLTWSVSEKELVELEDSTLMPWTNESYYRYDVNWLTLLTTLAVMAFTLFSIAYKLARLSFELTFNYVLALLVAPADIHDGQKTKKIMQSILNTFLVIILIFLSMKIYMIGTAYVATELDGLAYLIALIAFSVAVIDGPNIVERLFGIDAGLKNGWGVLAGAYAGGKLISGAGGAVMNTVNRSGRPGSGSGKEGEEQGTAQQSKGGGMNGKALSPNDGEGGINAQTGAAAAAARANGTAGKKGVADLSEENKGIEKNGQAPSPNDGIELSEEGGTAGTGGSANGAAVSGASGKVISPNDEKRAQEMLQGAESSGGHIPSPNDLEQLDSTTAGASVSRGSSSASAPSPNDADRAIGGSASSTTAGTEQNEQSIQRSVGRTNYGIESISEQTEGNTSIQSSSAGAASSPSPNGADFTVPISSTGGQSRTETANGASERLPNNTTVTRSGGDQVIDENIIINETQGGTVQGSTNVQSGHSGSVGAGALNSDIPASEGSATSNSATSRSISQNSTSLENITNETVVNRNLQQQTQQNDTARVNEIRRPRTHNLNQGSSNTLDRIKNFRRER